MKDFFKRTPLRMLVLLASILSSIVACLLLYFFAREVDGAYSKLISRDLKARTIIQSIFTQRLSNTENVMKIETATNTDTIELYMDKWYKNAIEIGNTFDSLQQVIPKDSSILLMQLNDVVAKRNIAITHTKNILILEKSNPNISILDSINDDSKAYHKAMNNFLNAYNNNLQQTNIALTNQTIKKSTLYLSVLPISLIILFIIFIYTVIAVLRDFVKEEE